MVRDMAVGKIPPTIPMNKWAKSPYCKLLLHCNGANDGTTFIDESPSPKTVTANGNSCTKTSIKRFGNSSAYFDGAGGTYISVIDSTATNFGSGDFTISFWIYTNNATLAKRVFSRQTGEGSPNYIYITANGYAYFTYSDGNKEFSTTSVITAGSWYHLAYIKYGTIISRYVNGTVNGTITGVNGSFTNGSVNSIIGAYENGQNYYGYLDEFTIWNGVAIPITDLYPARAPLYDYAISEWSGQ